MGQDLEVAHRSGTVEVKKAKINATMGHPLLHPYSKGYAYVIGWAIRRCTCILVVRNVGLRRILGNLVSDIRWAITTLVIVIPRRGVRPVDVGIGNVSLISTLDASPS